MIRINFQPYTRAQLETIVRARLASAKESLDEDSQDVIEEKAITMASMKVSGISGDARRVLDVCRLDITSSLTVAIFNLFNLTDARSN